jgi:hypothetical protein
MRKNPVVLTAAALGLLWALALAILSTIGPAASQFVAHADYFQYPCNYPFVGTGMDAKLLVVDAGGQYCDGPTEINWSHYHCWSGGATVNIGGFAFAPVGPLSLGGVGGSGVGGNGGQCRYVCPDGMVTGFPNPPAAWIKPLKLDPKNDDCVGHMGIRGDTSTPLQNQLPGNVQPGEDPPPGVPVPAAPGALPAGQTNPPAATGGPPPPDAEVPMPSGRPVIPDAGEGSPLTPGSPMQLP